MGSDVSFEIVALGFFCLALISMFLFQSYSWGLFGVAIFCLICGLLASYFKTHRSKFRVGEICLSLMVLWIAMDIYLTAWAHFSDAIWLTYFSTICLDSSFFGVPILLVGSVVAFLFWKDSNIIEAQKDNLPKKPNGILIIFGILFALCALWIIGVFLYGLMHFQ